MTQCCEGKVSNGSNAIWTSPAIVAFSVAAIDGYSVNVNAGKAGVTNFKRSEIKNKDNDKHVINENTATSKKDIVNTQKGYCCSPSSVLF